VLFFTPGPAPPPPPPHPPPPPPPALSTPPFPCAQVSGRVSFASFKEKAGRNGLPMALVFSKVDGKRVTRPEPPPSARPSAPLVCAPRVNEGEKGTASEAPRSTPLEAPPQTRSQSIPPRSKPAPIPFYRRPPQAKSTKPLIKAMSVEFRRRLLIAEIRNTAANKALVEEYGVTEFPSIVVVKKKQKAAKKTTKKGKGKGKGKGAATEEEESAQEEEDDDEEDVVVKFGKKITHNRLAGFLGDHALKKAVKGAPKGKKGAAEKSETKGEEKERKRRERAQREAEL
jgi:hypothetical protein